MQAIYTKYFKPGNVRGARIKAHSENYSSVTVPYDHAKSGQDVHFEAVKAFCSRYPGMGPASDFVAGSIKDGYAWVNPKR